MKPALIVLLAGALGGIAALAAGRPVRYAFRMLWMREDLPEIQAQAIAAVLVALAEA